ncbi:variant erythrocyte surface antigen-1 family protein [Babesia caballi]|uniref:Variant erythrocyte surface antigen-1 family protein n=1 Tax=Babesia caballi TaxID=5871 RepID=A0AAV4LWU4_BABCB|nr:variant erythrocyte surface antigen-1 family protein [Babesia caballi]
MSAPKGKSLTECPSNLKEAIDWILRVTGKDGGGGDATSKLAEAVQGLLGKALSEVDILLGKGSVNADEFQKLKHGLQKAKQWVEEKPQGYTTDGPISRLSRALARFIGYEDFRASAYSGPDNWQITGAGIALKSYASSYPSAAKWESVNSPDDKKKLCAKIFLGCVPLCFYGLSYLYWRCSDQGGWKGLTFSDDISPALKHFMEAAGFDTKKHTNPSKSGADIATALQNFNGFQSAINGNSSFTHFFKSVKNSLEGALQPKPKTIATSHPLSTLFLGASCYFESKRPKTPQSPSTIRQMLYWLSSLTITPQFGELLDHIDSMFPSGPMSVAISGSVQTGETLSADDLAGHLVTSCISAVQVIRSIQGRSVSDDPLLHYIYRNSEFSYPSSGSALFNTLSKYTYALQFQLSFLHQQCMSGITTCGWRLCKFGSAVPSHDQSHICPLKCKNGNNSSSCRHDGKHQSSGCNHYNECGSGANMSPLQAFLTDNLKGFSLSKNPDLSSFNHLNNHTPGSMCHIKMGFNAESLRSSGKGVYIFTALNDFCSHSNTPLRQLSEKLGCLTKRTPRSLGDIFGFYLQLVGQLFDNRLTMASFAANILVNLELSDEFQMFAINRYPPLKETYEKLVQSRSQAVPSGLSRSLNILYNDLPFWFQLFMVDDSRDMAASLFDMRQHCHNKNDDNTKHYSPDGQKQCSHNSNHAADLWSLYYPGCTGQPCGKYLSPLCHSTGATFAPKFAVTYLSWVLYLGDDLQSGFQEMLDEFQSVECTTVLGCKTPCSHNGDQHGRSSCTCQSVVQCGGVLPLLYRHGFQFMDAKDLKNNTKACTQFHSQISKVLSPDAPLHNLLMAIDEFLYYVRFRFMSTVSSFWLCSFLILLYFIFYGIDVLHFKSHARFPSSHGIPPIGLLTTGKAPAITKLTYYMP